jgi:hypothetical protein
MIEQDKKELRQKYGNTKGIKTADQIIRLIDDHDRITEKIKELIKK